MKLDLLERIFQDLHTIYYLEEAIQKANLFYSCVLENNARLDSDYWIQLGRDWDLNIWKVSKHTCMALYIIKDTGTDTSKALWVTTI